MENVIVTGKVLALRPLERSELKGVYSDAIVSFVFYEAIFLDNKFLLIKGKKDKKYSPLQYRSVAERIGAIKGLPCVFLFDSLATYERNRLIERGVHFIVSEKYVFLPFLLINAKSGAEIKTDALLSVSQYLLMYHLQVQSLEGCSLSELELIVPYKYILLSRAVRQLEMLHLCECPLDEVRQKRVHFMDSNSELWSKAMKYMRSPVNATYFLNAPFSDGAIAGINALSVYSHLNPDNQPCYAINEERLKLLKEKYTPYELNQIEGDVKLEIWKYPPIIADSQQPVVDKLSLYLTIKEDSDPRIEKELEQMMNEIW